MKLGWPEIVVILVVVMLLFGSARLPELARSIGKSAKELRKGMREDDEEEPDEKV